MAANKLPESVKAYIVEALACFDSPSTVADAVNREFEVSVSRQQVERYDPTKRAGQNLSKKYRAIFEATRRGFISDTTNIGWAHRATRLRMIQRVGEKAERMGNLSLALQAAEQAAKEEGQIFTNRRELSGPNGSAIPTETEVRVRYIRPDHPEAIQHDE